MATISDSIQDLSPAEIEARKRRERILQLKKKKENIIDDCTEENSESLKNNALVEEKNTENHIPSAEKQIQKLAIEDQDITKIASRKIDWDLKKGIEKNLTILQERTNEIIAEIVREQVEAEEASEH